MLENAYFKYISATRVATAWIGAAFGPIFIVAGVNDESNAHLVVGLVLLAAVATTISKGFQAQKEKSKLGFVVYSVVPIILILPGILLAWISYDANV